MAQATVPDNIGAYRIFARFMLLTQLIAPSRWPAVCTTVTPSVIVLLTWKTWPEKKTSQIWVGKHQSICLGQWAHRSTTDIPGQHAQKHTYIRNIQFYIRTRPSTLPFYLGPVGQWRRWLLWWHWCCWPKSNENGRCVAKKPSDFPSFCCPFKIPIGKKIVYTFLSIGSKSFRFFFTIHIFLLRHTRAELGCWYRTCGYLHIWLCVRPFFFFSFHLNERKGKYG